jgi:hypothetical protein
MAVADPGQIEGDSHHLWWIFAALGLAAFLAGVALRLLGGGGGDEVSEAPKRQNLPDRDADSAHISAAQPA